MSRIKNEVKRILEQADERLRRAIADAATAGDLRGVDIARSAAGRIRQALDLMEVERPLNHSVAEWARGRRSTDAPTPQKQQKKKSKYPIYLIRNGALSRIGWSKKQKSEYEHRVPKDIFNRTIDTLATLSEHGTPPFTSEGIIEEVNRTGQTSIPSYQIYVVIGLLRDAGFIEQVGREGYRVSDDLRQGAQAAWTSLSNAKS